MKSQHITHSTTIKYRPLPAYGFLVLLVLTMGLSGCHQTIALGLGGCQNSPPASAGPIVQKRTVAEAAFVPIIFNSNGNLSPAYPNTGLEITNRLAPSDGHTPAGEWWLRSDERLAVKIDNQLYEVLDMSGVYTCNACTFSCDNGIIASLPPGNFGFEVTRTVGGNNVKPSENLSVQDICPVRQRREFTPVDDEMFELKSEFRCAEDQSAYARLTTRIVPAGGPRTYSAELKRMPGGNAPERYYWAVDAGNPASLPLATAKWTVNFSRSLKVRSVNITKNPGELAPEPVNISRINVETGCISGYDLSGEPVFDMSCLNRERHKCTPPANNTGQVALYDRAQCLQGAIEATPTYFTENGGSVRERIFWVVEFDSGAPPLGSPDSLRINFTF